MIKSFTGVKDCFVIEQKLFEDMRGFFLETFKEKDFHKIGLPTYWPQDNQSGSKQDVLRGLHIQRRNPQGKLVRCTHGAVYDVCLDLRKESPTFLRWHGEILTGGKSMYCPPGTAHGFLALEPDSVVYYKCTSLHDPETDGGLQALDHELGIKWPLPPNGLIMSQKDKELPSLKQWLEDPRGLWNG